MTGKFKMYVRMGGLNHNYKIRKGGPIKKNMYVRREWGVKKFSCHSPPYSFFFRNSPNGISLPKNRGQARNQMRFTECYV